MSAKQAENDSQFEDILIVGLLSQRNNPDVGSPVV